MDDGAEEKVPLLVPLAPARLSGTDIVQRRGPRSVSRPRAPPERPAWDIFPLDVWVEIVAFAVPPAPRKQAPLTAEDRARAVVLAHTCHTIRNAVANRLDPGWERQPLLYTVPGLCGVCGAEQADPHLVLANAVFVYPARFEAAQELRRSADDAARNSLRLLVLTSQWTYLALFLPTALALLGLLRVTWCLWTVAVAAVLFVPLIALGTRASFATLRWWHASNPRGWAVPPRPCHLCHPTPWLRVTAILSGTVLIGLLLLWGSWSLGLWLDRQAFQNTQWILVALMICCYCP
eukprot:TRINITY_DN5090_c0_g1_i1.p1 TRINITY_DN5090_c0_g1~~TRINITY_DN5090_c0_g1_i1.p1  ORF type:complete len:343 (+),score=99.49 TRINITY_DN5090_c0_g1_i1:156-1031(+)